MKKLNHSNSNQKSVGGWSTIIPTLIFLISTIIPIEAEGEYKIPDFAFPKDVETQSDSLLSISLKNKDFEMALRYGVNVCISRNLSGDFETTEENIGLLDSISKELSEPYRNVCQLIMAQILADEYAGSPELYESRNLPLETPYPKDVKDWSALMFKQRIYELVDSATSNLKGLSPTPIKEISLLLTETENKEGLTIPQFLAFKGVELLKTISSPHRQTIIPFYKKEIEETVEGKSGEKINSLLKLLIEKLSEDNSVVKALAMTEVYDFSDDNDKEGYLIKCQEELNDTEGEGVILYELWKRNGEDNYQYYNEIGQWLEKFPSGYNSSSLRYALSRMTRQGIEVEYPSLSLPGQAIRGKVTISNLAKGYLLIYKLKEGQFTVYDEVILKKLKGSSQPYKVIEIEGKKEIPFKDTQDIELPPLTEGLYVIIPSKTRNPEKEWNKSYSGAHYSTIRITNISLITSFDSNEEGSGKAYVVSALNQQPIKGALVKYYKGDNKTPVGKLFTNEEGWVKIPSGYYRLEAVAGKSIARRDGGFSYFPETERTNRQVTILTDLSVYRTGDTIQYAVIGWQQEKYKNSLLRESQIIVKLRDANYIEVGTDTLVLNNEGRSNGSLVIPKGRLLGHYSLTAQLPEFKDLTAGSAQIDVEEYKLPAFLVKLSQEETGEEDNVKFRGEALTYSGMPVSDAKVEIKVEYLPWRWGGGGQNASYIEQMESDSDGKFEIQLPLSNLRNTIFSQGRYLITAEVSSSAGETEKSSPLFFYLGSQNEIRPSISDKIEVTGSDIRLNVPVFDMANLPVKERIKYKITCIDSNKDANSKKDVILQGEFESPALVLPSDSLPSGRYKFEFFGGGSNTITTEATLWRKTDSVAPYPTELWIPETQYYYSDNQDYVEVVFGSYWNDWILYTLTNGEKILESKWIKPEGESDENGKEMNGEGPAKLQRVKIDIPEGTPTLFLTLCGMHDFKANAGTIKLEPKSNLERMEIESTSFRDRISSGSHEKWTFKFKIAEKNAGYVNAFAVMTDQALNSIEDFRWNLNMWLPPIYSKYHITPQRTGNAVTYKFFGKSDSFYPKALSPIPVWQTYGYPLVSWSGLRAGGTVLYKAMATRNAISDAVSYVQAEAADEAIVEMAEESRESDNPDIEIRPVEMPLAFFKPDLQSNEIGEVEVEFTVPNFNTTWQIQVAGYNDELLSATKILETVASKTVMVKTNLPQFLRTGDMAEISATLYNNSEKTIPIKGKIEIIDPTTGNVITAKETVAEGVNPSANANINISFNVPDNLNALCVRSFAYGENHYDGEQGMVIVLPSSTPVVESVTFYAGSSEDKITLNIPKLEKHANVTLKYCDSPLWDVLLSLPSLKENADGSSLSIGKWLYSALYSLDIVNQNKKIADGLRNILHSEDTTLQLSQLQKDPSLKTVELISTPWVNDASSETERIKDLEQYLNPAEVNSGVQQKIDMLKKLQMKDGGFSWLPQMKTSSYITFRMIEIFSMLRKKGLLNEDLEGMARKAVKYYDDYIVELCNSSKRNKNFPTVQFADYLYSRKVLSFPTSKEFRKLEMECMDSIGSQWRHWSIGQKAKAAIVLEGNERYQNESQMIGESLKQFMNKRMTLSELALLLDLYMTFGNNEETTEQIREKIFLQKETEGWSKDPDVLSVINAVTQGLTNDDIERTIPVITINKKAIQLQATQSLTGEYTVNLDPKEVSGKVLEITREPGIPAWGGVISQYIKPIKDVKATKVDNLSIEKSILIEDEKGKVRKGKSLRKGDKVKVTLNITCLKDMDYVIIRDNRSACMRPDSKNSGMIYIAGVGAYQEIRSDRTSFFIERMPAGKYVISYDCHVEREGEYTIGITEIQSLYAPWQVSHSAGSTLRVNSTIFVNADANNGE